MEEFTRIVNLYYTKWVIMQQEMPIKFGTGTWIGCGRWMDLWVVYSIHWVEKYLPINYDHDEREKKFKSHTCCLNKALENVPHHICMCVCMLCMCMREWVSWLWQSVATWDNEYFEGNLEDIHLCKSVCGVWLWMRKDVRACVILSPSFSRSNAIWLFIYIFN